MTTEIAVHFAEKFHLAAGMPFLLKELFHVAKHTVKHWHKIPWKRIAKWHKGR